MPKPQAEAAKPAAAAPAQDPQAVARGKQLFQTMACFTCHKAPDFPDMPTHAQAPSYIGGIFGHKTEVTVGIGGPKKTITVDDDYFIESIQNPLAKIVINEKTGQAYQPIMPPLPVTDAQIEDLMVYVKSLGVHAE
jgi:cytochrome c oxidase subunit 2